MVYWQKFNPEEFEFEFNEQELAAHKISIDETMEIIWNGFACVEISGIRVGMKSSVAPMAGAS